jgi:hypothetical protein
MSGSSCRNPQEVAPEDVEAAHRFLLASMNE